MQPAGATATGESDSKHRDRAARAAAIYLLQNLEIKLFAEFINSRNKNTLTARSNKSSGAFKHIASC